MTVRFEQVLSEGVAACSYLLGDDAAGTAAVIDPRPDVEVYLERARHLGVAITHVFETHIHADFMSGARELVDRLGNGAKLCVSVEGGAEYGFAHEPVREGNRYIFGGLEMEARFAPGHTPEHLSYLIYESGRDEPWGVITGDSFFVDSVGRPDLLGDEKTDQLTEALFRTVNDFYMKLDDGVIVYPGHAAGSACGPDIGDRLSSTIGYERRHNPYTHLQDLESFRSAIKQNAPPVPTHYPRLKRVNAAGPPVLGGLPKVPALPAKAFAQAIEDGAQLLDTRDMLAFGAGHIAGALNIGARPELSVWAGWLLDPQKPILLVLEDDQALPRVLRLLWRTGFVDFGGYLAGSMSAWRESGLPMTRIPQIPVHDLRAADATVQPLDVRGEDEWQGGRIPGAQHIFLGELRERLPELDRERSYATYCASGFRASIAASILAAAGFTRVHNVPGSWKAWKSAGYDVEGPTRGRKDTMQDIIGINDRYAVAKFAPAGDAIAKAADEGFKSIVNLRTPDEKQELGPDAEGRIVEEQGLSYLHHPVSGDNLSDQVVDRFREKVEDMPGPVLVHCASGKRSGALVMMHLAIEQGLSGQQVIDKAAEMGFECDTPQLESFVRNYVDRRTAV